MPCNGFDNVVKKQNKTSTSLACSRFFNLINSDRWTKENDIYVNINTSFEIELEIQGVLVITILRHVVAS